MTHKEREKYISEILKQCAEARNVKGMEYSGREDANLNFKQGENIGVDKFQTCWIFTQKHLNSIQSFVKYKKTFSDESLDNRIVDAINYLLFIGSMEKEDKYLTV